MDDALEVGIDGLNPGLYWGIRTAKFGDPFQFVNNIPRTTLLIEVSGAPPFQRMMVVWPKEMDIGPYETMDYEIKAKVIVPVFMSNSESEVEPDDIQL